MRIGLLAILVVASCASNTAQVEVSPGQLVAPEQAGEPLELTAERNSKRTRNAFVYVEVTLENKGTEFLSVEARSLDAIAGMPAAKVVAGKELAAWIENEINRDASSSRSSVGFSIGGFGFGGGGVGMGAGVGVSSGGGGRSAQADGHAAREAMMHGDSYPNDHLFAGEITVAPDASIKRWVLLQLDSDKVAKAEQKMTLDVVLHARNSDRERRYRLVF